jgi:hypothetical protein
MAEAIMSKRSCTPGCSRFQPARVLPTEEVAIASARQPSFDASAASPPARDASPSGVAAANVEPLKRHRASTYGFSESVSIMSANELRRGVGLPAGGAPSRGLECLGLWRRRDRRSAGAPSGLSGWGSGLSLYAIAPSGLGEEGRHSPEGAPAYSLGREPQD